MPIESPGTAVVWRRRNGTPNQWFTLSFLAAQKYCESTAKPISGLKKAKPAAPFDKRHPSSTPSSPPALGDTRRTCRVRPRTRVLSGRGRVPTTPSTTTPHSSDGQPREYDEIMAIGWFGTKRPAAKSAVSVTGPEAVAGYRGAQCSKSDIGTRRLAGIDPKQSLVAGDREGRKCPQGGPLEFRGRSSMMSAARTRE
jgi:hypothetical protein